MASPANISRQAAVEGLASVAAAAALASCFSPGESRAAETYSSTFRVGRFLVDTGTRDIRVRHSDDPSRALWETAAGKPFLSVGAGHAVFNEHGDPLGSFTVTDSVPATADVKSIAQKVRTIGPDHIMIAGTLTQSGPTFRLSFQAVSGNQLRFVISLDGAGTAKFNRITLRYASSGDEAYFGFGQQLTYFNQKGRQIPILVQEKGVGRGLPGVTQFSNLLHDGAAGTPVKAAAPAPHYITSRMRSLFLENLQYSTFDMRAAKVTEIELYASEMTGRILFGQTPLALIEEYTAYAGRMRALPAYVQEGAIVCVQGGTNRVNQLFTKLLAAKVPVAAMWVQDWSGRKVTAAGQQVLWNWELSPTSYPEWDELVARLAQQGSRVFVYMNPFIVPGRLYDEAESKGYLVKRGGTTFVYKNSSIRAGMFDLSNPGARVWVKELIKRNLIGIKASGWMADFGEALPFDAELYEGADPQVWHNRYPEAWARVHREAIDETGRGDQCLFWNRSGFTQSPGVATAFWLGDQLQSWDEYDGIKTAVVGLLSGGISGFSLTHSDIGGFIAAKLGKLPVIVRTPELLMRWIELNAFTPIFRSHEGLLPAISAQIDTNGTTMAHFARFARTYKALAAYRISLGTEATEKGHPLVRHLFLHYPNDPAVLQLRYQFMLGSDFLVAPVLDKGAGQVRVYLPAGEWVHLWSGRPYSISTSQWHDVSAPLGQPAVFYVKNSRWGEQLVTSLRASGDL